MGLIHGNNIGGGGGGAGAPVSDHGNLTGLADDDHTQYHNDTRATTWLGTKSTADLPDSLNKRYVTDALANSGLFYDQSVSPTNGQTSFSLDFLPTNNSSVFMIINGITFTPGKGFIISGTTITWGESFTIQDSDVILLRYKK